jgi:hypothetical protein
MAEKKKQDKLQHLPACAADFIKQVINRMRYRHKVQQEVQEELAAHFEDELKDCSTDEEKTQKAEQLITDFGDAKMLSALLRRAKKRCRPLWQTATERIFEAICLSLIVYIIWFISGSPVISTDYINELNQIAQPVVDESLNAAPLYIEAAKLYEQLLRDDFRELKVLSKRSNELAPEEKEFIKQWLSDNKNIFEPIVAGSKKPYCWFKYQTDSKYQGEVKMVLVPHLMAYHDIGYSLCLRALLHAEEGRIKDALDDIKACYLFGKHLQHGTTLVEQLIGLDIWSYPNETLRNILSKNETDSQLLADFQGNFEQIIASENFVISLTGEKISVLDQIQRCFTNGSFGEHLYLPIIIRNKNSYHQSETYSNYQRITNLILQGLFTHPYRKGTQESMDKLFDYWEQLSLKTPAQIHTELININKEYKLIVKGNSFLENIAPDSDSIRYFIESGSRNKVETNTTLTIIAITRYKQDKGRYPQNLEQLVTNGYLKQLPIDPFSDKPLVYKQTGDDFILYSFGLNCTDDDGQPSRDNKGRIQLWENKGDAVFWPVQKEQ